MAQKRKCIRNLKKSVLANNGIIIFLALTFLLFIEPSRASSKQDVLAASNFVLYQNTVPNILDKKELTTQEEKRVKDEYEINIRVINLSKITEFTGEAIAVNVDAKFVVSALILDSKSIYKDKKSTIGFPVHYVSFFAIRSPVKLFYESDIVGKEYSIRVEIEIVDGRKSYWLTVL